MHWLHGLPFFLEARDMYNELDIQKFRLKDDRHKPHSGHPG